MVIDLTAVAVLDPNGVMLPDASVVSDTGFEYPTVPEPRCCVLAFIGLLIGGLARIRIN